MRFWRALWSAWWVLWAIYAIPWGFFDGQAHWDRVVWVPFFPLRARDAFLNLVFFIPFGYLGGRASWRWPSVVAAAASVSLLTELVQVFAVERWPSTTDLIMNVGGAVVGVLIARR